MPKVVIFDFDGTIADTFVMVVDIFYKLNPRWPVMPKGEVERLRGMAMAEVVHELRIPWWRIPFLLLRGRKMMAQQIADIVLIPGMDDVVRELHARGHTLYVISSNSSSNVSKFLEHHALLHYFTEVKGSAALFGKTRIIKKMISHAHADRDNVCYIGDEVRDMHASKHAGVRSVAVSWGFNNIHVLSATNPDVLVFDPADIVGAVEA